MEANEALDRLRIIVEMIDRCISPVTPLILLQIKEVALGIEDEKSIGECEVLVQPVNNRFILSCDASIKENPGGPSAVGVVIEQPDGAKLKLSQLSPATSNNQAEYDAIYFALTSLMGLNNNPGAEVEVRSDSQLIIRQLTGEIECRDEQLKKRRDLILELVRSLPVPVIFQWRPRNNTPELKQANYICQDALGVRRH